MPHFGTDPGKPLALSLTLYQFAEMGVRYTEVVPELDADNTLMCLSGDASR